MAYRPHSPMMMHSASAPSSSWSTSSYGDKASTSPMELMELGSHLGTCRGAHGKLFAMRCAAERMNGFVTARFVTSLLVAGLLIGGVCLLIS